MKGKVKKNEKWERNKENKEEQYIVRK
jgi:hypothetical protein